MKKLSGMILLVFMIVPLIAFVRPVQAITESEAQAIVDAANQAVQNTLTELQTANDSGDTARISVTLAALDLAIQTYSVASSELASIQAGDSGNDAVLTTSAQVAGDLNSFSTQLEANNIDGALSSLSSAQDQAASLPAVRPGMPKGLANIASKIVTAAAQASSLLGHDEGHGASEIIRHRVGSPI